MLLTITTTYNPATDLGFLLHKNPAKVQSFELSFGKAHVFYPVVTPERCTVALLLDVDTISLVRGKIGAKNAGNDQNLQQYVNDRPYVASSFLSVAIARVFGDALNGRSRERSELANTNIPLAATVSVVASKSGEGGEQLLKKLFEPLGYRVSAKNYLLDATVPEWGFSPYYTLTLQTEAGRLSDLLTHLYVLLPVLDEEKHYWVGDDEVEKLLRRGESWLSQHPERNLITSRYLKKQQRLVKAALSRLISQEEEAEAVELSENSELAVDVENLAENNTTEEQALTAITEVATGGERPPSLNEQRLAAVVAALRQSEAERVLDLGCGEGKLLAELLQDKQFKEIVGMDISWRALEYAKSRLHFDRLPASKAKRIRLIHGSLTYRDKRLSGYEAAAVVEVIEHLDLPRLAAFERVLFEFARPQTVVITTPNREYNVKFESMPADKLRHHDHRFEWSREEFQNWAKGVASRFGYSEVNFSPIGPVDDSVGAPTQMAIFKL